MPHVDLTLSELSDQHPARPGYGRAASAGSLNRWASVVELAAEPCLLLDVDGTAVSVSPACRDIFGIDPQRAVGRPLVDGVLRLLDFNAVSGELPGWQVDKIPPLLAITSGGLARGLLRIPSPDGTPSTVDAIATPLRDRGMVVGSLTFFALVGR
ncbi:MAG TPA: PAS domain-containing protein [Micromonosporaceae bacterium]